MSDRVQQLQAAQDLLLACAQDMEKLQKALIEKRQKGLIKRGPEDAAYAAACNLKTEARQLDVYIGAELRQARHKT